MTRIYFQKYVADDGSMRMDLIAEELPKKFLGLASDIVLGDNVASYQSFEIGQVFQELQGSKQPIYMIDQQSDRLVLGLSLKANDLPKINDGILGSFYFTQDFEHIPAFEKQVLSIFDQGRTDLQDVSWSQEMAVYDQRWESGIILHAPQIDTAMTESVEFVEYDSMETNLGVVGEADLPTVEDTGKWPVELWLFLIPFVVGLAYLIYRKLSSVVVAGSANKSVEFDAV